MWFTAWMEPSLIEISSAVPPADSTAFRGSVYSTSSTPSVARKAILLPLIDVAIVVLLPLLPSRRPASASPSVTPVPGLRAGKRGRTPPVHQFAAVPGAEDRRGQRDQLDGQQTAAGHPVGGP